MNAHTSGQVAGSAAEIYEQFFVPALFAGWPPRVVQAAAVQTGDTVLDVACGTGILARAAARRAGRHGAVVGLDVNDGMLAVARQKAPGITWRRGTAESLPFADHAFDRVVSQFGLMFFDDPVQALAEMARVTRPGGRIAVAVWAGLDATPGYAAVADMLDALFGAEIALAIQAPYALGDPQKLLALFRQAGLGHATLDTLPGQARFASIDAWLYTDIRGWTLADIIDDAGYARLREAAPAWLSRFELPDGAVAFDAPAHVVTVRR